jgi:predicted tellurium resistance membrane protein TerC
MMRELIVLEGSDLLQLDQQLLYLSGAAILAMALLHAIEHHDADWTNSQQPTAPHGCLTWRRR